MGRHTDTGHEQSLRYAEELRELYRRERRRAAELEAREAELETLRAIDMSILGVAPFEETLGIAGKALGRLLTVDRLEIKLYDPERRTLRAVETEDPETGPIREEPLPEGGPVADAVRSGEPATGALDPEGPGWEALTFAAGMRSYLVVPLVAEGNVIGVLLLSTHRPHPYPEGDVRTAQRIAAQLAVALRAGRLARETLRRARQLDAVRQVSESVAGSLDLHVVLQAGLDQALDATGLDAGAAYLVDQPAGELVMVCERGTPEPLRGSFDRIPLGSPLAELAMGDGSSTLLHNLLDDPRFVAAEELKAAGVASISALVAPLHWQGEVIGLLMLGSLSGHILDEADLRTVEAVARPIAAGVGRARLHENLRRVDEERRRLLGRLVSAQEEERRRMANDLHDDSIQVMAAVGMELGALRHTAPPEHDPRLRELEQTISDSIGRLRRLMVELRPPGLDREGLAMALQQTLERMEDRDGISWRLDDRLRREIPVEIRTTVYRIAQEALVNIRKHSRARSVEVHVEERHGGVLSRVRDDGVGFSLEDHTSSSPEHIGLASMRERAEVAGGWWRIDSAPGKGTTVEFWIPEGAAT